MDFEIYGILYFGLIRSRMANEAGRKVLLLVSFFTVCRSWKLSLSAASPEILFPNKPPVVPHV